MNLLVFLLTLRVTSVVQGCQQSTEMKKKTDEETVGRGNIGKNAMVVSGGLNADGDNVGVKVELIYPDGNKSCHLPDLPDQRMFHTHDGNIVCGGGHDSGNTSENCIEFMIPKEWNVKINTMCIEKFEKGCNELLEERFGNWSNLTVIGVSAF